MILIDSCSGFESHGGCRTLSCGWLVVLSGLYQSVPEEHSDLHVESSQVKPLLQTNMNKRVNNNKPNTWHSRGGCRWHCGRPVDFSVIWHVCIDMCVLRGSVSVIRVSIVSMLTMWHCPWWCRRVHAPNIDCTEKHKDNKETHKQYYCQQLSNRCRLHCVCITVTTTTSTTTLLFIISSATNPHNPL